MSKRSNVEWMQDRWEALARENAEFFIWTDVAKGDDFFASGRRDVDRILALASGFYARRQRALEIGCGVGRLTIPMSQHFAEVIGVDIAPTMLTKLATNCVRAGISNVSPAHASDAWDTRGPVDFAYSHIVFQHIEEWGLIEEYFRRVASCLAPTGAFYAQFDTRPVDLPYRVRNALPEFMLPRVWIRGVRRIRRSAKQIVGLAASHGLLTAHSSGAGTSDTAFVFTRADNK